ncbi:MAG: ergothioneine biosynthesis protein EgtB [Bacteroidota bacterium]
MTTVLAQPAVEISLKARFAAVRNLTDQICEPLKPDDYGGQPILDVSPPKWHLAHTTWFWEEFILTKHLPGYKSFHPKFAFLFNSYYDTIGEHIPRPKRGALSRPTVEEIVAYRHYVDEHMLKLLEQTPAEISELVEIGLNHEQQHQELLFTDIKYILGNNPLFPPYKEDFSEIRQGNFDNNFILVPGGSFPIGFSGEGFSFDNEHGHHQVGLEEFSIRKSLVSNSEYLDFINDDGYAKPSLWLSDGWAWVNENKISAPLYWNIVDGKLMRYSLAGLKELNLEEPVTHISFYEALAFAAWKGLRLPTEFEWEAAAEQFSWGERWEHTNSAYLPYPRYRKPKGAIGEYNGKFMINQMVLRGASVVTPQGHSRKTYRNFFPPSSRWQFNGIRLCK